MKPLKKKNDKGYSTYQVIVVLDESEEQKVSEAQNSNENAYSTDDSD